MSNERNNEQNEQLDQAGQEKKAPKKKMSKKMIAGITSAVILVAAVAGGSYAYVKSQTVASVDGERITKEELYDTLVGVYGPSAVDNLVTKIVINKEADKRDVKVKTSEINAEVAVYEENYGGEEGLKSALKSSGLTLADLKEDIETNIKIEKLMAKDIKLTDDEVKAYYEENKQNFDTPESIEVSHILVEDKKTAQKVLDELKKGKDFADLAKEYSTDTATAEKGGELGFITHGEMVEEFEDAAFALKVGETSDIVKSSYGYHIIKATDYKEAKESTYEDSKEQAKEAALAEKISSEYSSWVEELKEKYDIKTNL
ncbi:peptidylprolyl isomerase [Pradoshia eiseniae]|nr:peptidylprolyl isomerase [Pradoshia eiseniae]